MKPMRMLGLGLAATLAMCAMAVLPAVANAQEESIFAKMQYCPLEVEGLWGCTFEQSNSTSSFKAGNIEIHLVNPITLQGGVTETGLRGQGLGGLFQLHAAVGAPTLTPVAEPGPILDEYVDPSKFTSEYEEGQWIAAEHKAEQAHHIFFVNEPTTVTIELAGSPEEIYVCAICILFEENEGDLTLPVKVKLSSAFLGENCYVGSNEEPIEIELTSGQSGEVHGSHGELKFPEHFLVVALLNNSLVNGTYAAPEAKDCGLRGEAGEAINGPLGLPSPSGNNNAIINGDIYLTRAAVVERYRREQEG